MMTAPSFRMSPDVRKKVDKGRLYTDIIGLSLVYTLGGFVPASFQWLLSIYTIMAWVTILTIDPTRLPDATATKRNQHKAWLYQGLLLPIYIMGMWLVALPIKSVSIAVAISLVVNAGMMELYYRNILQATLRRLGLSRIGSIGLQSVAFAAYFYFHSHSLLISSVAVIIGCMNGIIVYKTRSIYANMLMTILFVIFFGH